MSEEEKEALEGLKKLKNLELTFTSYSFCNGKVMLDEEGKTIIDTILNLIEKKQKEIEKQNEIIDLMAEQLKTDIHSKEWVKKYYNSKVLD